MRIEALSAHERFPAKVNSRVLELIDMRNRTRSRICVASDSLDGLYRNSRVVLSVNRDPFLSRIARHSLSALDRPQQAPNSISIGQ